MHLQVYNLIGITERWWDSSQDWSAEMAGYWLFRQDRLGRQGVRVVREEQGYLELCLEVDDKSFSVRMSGQTNICDTGVGISRLPDQEAVVDEAFFRQKKKA